MAGLQAGRAARVKLHSKFSGRSAMAELELVQKVQRQWPPYVRPKVKARGLAYWRDRMAHMEGIYRGMQRVMQENPAEGPAGLSHIGELRKFRATWQHAFLLIESAYRYAQYMVRRWEDIEEKHGHD